MSFGDNSGKSVKRCGNNLEKVLKISVRKLDFFWIKLWKKREKHGEFIEKSPIRYKLNLLTVADSSTNTKTNRTGQKMPFFGVGRGGGKINLSRG